MASRRALRRHEENRALRRRLRQRCVCGKVIATSAEDAWDLAQRQWARFGGEPARRVYRCDHNRKAWHWTRKEAWVA